MPKRKRTPSLTAGEAAAPSPDGPTYGPAAVATTTFNRLCEMCQQIFRLARQLKSHQHLKFYTCERLRRSAVEKRCHLCCKLQTLIVKTEMLDKSVTDIDALSVGIHQFKGNGISLLLLLFEEPMASIDLLFEHATEFKAMKFFHSKHTQSEEAWAQISSWISFCTNNHPDCRSERQRRRSKPPSVSELPTRFLAVGNVGDLEIRVCETRNLPIGALPVPPYTTLSHRWGDFKPTQLLREGYQSFLQGIRLETLPKTFKDAVLVTRKLGVPYLWIDSLCIIQNSVDDWRIESAKMHRVYRHSFLNICAAASGDATGGLFHPRDPLSVVPCVIQRGSREGQCLASIYEPDIVHDEAEIQSRAWVFQELALAPRVLFFTREELLWKCYDLGASETLPDGVVDYFNRREHSMPLYRRLISLQTEGHSWVSDAWDQLVKEYSGKKLTRFSDKLVAVAGLAAEFGRVWTNETYLAGLWSFRLRHGLLWNSITPDIPQQLLSYTAPSWSWASMDAKCYIRGSDYRYREGLSEVLSASVQLANASNPYGRVLGGSVSLEGPLVEVLVSSPCDEKRDDKWVITFDTNYDGALDDDLANLGMLNKVPTTIWWDDGAIREFIKAATVHLAALELMITERGLSLVGLILTPTKAGEYRRLGLFRVEDEWQERVDISAVTKALRVTPDVDEFGSEEGAPTYHLTAVYYEAALTEISNREATAKRDPRFGIMEKRMAAMTGNPDGLRRNDPYRNGVIDRSLYRRYKVELADEDYPLINSFLGSVYSFNEASGKTRPGYCGDGYFRFEII